MYVLCTLSSKEYIPLANSRRNSTVWLVAIDIRHMFTIHRANDQKYFKEPRKYFCTGTFNFGHQNSWVVKVCIFWESHKILYFSSKMITKIPSHYTHIPISLLDRNSGLSNQGEILNFTAFSDSIHFYYFSDASTI